MRRLSSIGAGFSTHTHEDPRDSWPECEECGYRFDPREISDSSELICGECQSKPKCDRCGERDSECEWELLQKLKRMCSGCAARQEDIADALRDDRMDEAREEAQTMREYRGE